MPPVLRQHVAALRMLLVFTVITGAAYPLAVTGIAQAAFPRRANGSLVTFDGRTAGSSRIGQNFDLPGAPAGPDPKWFQPRPSAAGDGGYDAAASAASNLGPNDAELIRSVTERRAAVAAFDGVRPEDVPVDALTASGSGLDPDISPAYAYQQVARVARTRHLAPAPVRALVARHVAGRDLGFLGQETVDVVGLNRDLAAPR